MKRRTRTTILVLFILTALALSACDAVTTNNNNGALSASGLIEATEVSVAPELSGRVIEVFADEGQAVEAGDVLFRLDGSLLQAQKTAAQAALISVQASTTVAQTNLEAARVQLRLTLDAARELEMPVRQAEWTQEQPGEFDQPVWYFSQDEIRAAAQTEIESAREALQEAREMLSETLDKVASTQFLEAEEELVRTRVSFENAEDVLDRAGDARDGEELKTAAQEAYDDALDELEKAQVDYDNALTTDGANEVLEARAEVIVARERLDNALDQLRSLQTGDHAPEVVTAGKAVEIAEAALTQAEAAVGEVQANLDLLDAQIAKLTIIAPIDGVILTRSIQPGEVAQAGMTAMTVAYLNDLTLTVYIPEDRYGQVSLGDQAELQVDSFPGVTFTAAVTRIADKAEYTPRNVQTKEERQTTVYAVELAVQNPEGRLKPGMPVDVIFNP